MRYDACILGAGAEGLAAAAWLAGRGLAVFVAEREAHCGGRCTTREFHPGFGASPYMDELPPIPDELFREFDLARRGTVFLPPRPDGLAPLRQAIMARVMGSESPRRRWFAPPPPVEPWPGEQLSSRTLAEMGTGVPAGVVCDPAAGGSALVALAAVRGGMVAGGLGRLADALTAAAKDAGAEISLGLEAADIRRRRGQVVAVTLADGSEIAARAVISTLDLEHTFLSLFAWNELPGQVVERVHAYRPGAGTARLLLALRQAPALGGEPIFIGGKHLGRAYQAWRSGAVAEHLPLVARLVSAVDPSLAPDGAATLTLTAGGIPHAPFDGGWSHERRERLRRQMLEEAEAVLPGLRDSIAGWELLVPPDIENQLGLTAGDLWGGELAADQMLRFRPFPECPRTPIKGLYLAGGSSPLGPLATGASGVAAARALAADLTAGRLK